MSHIFGTDVDFNSNEAKKFRVENLLNFPSVGTGDVGRIFSHTGQQTFYGWNGSAWLDLALAGGGSYVLPTASETILGGVKIDASTINIDGGGVISASGWTDPSGLEALDEGNFFGWRLISRDPLYYGNLGYDAKDFGVNYALNSTLGATGSLSVNFSEDGLITGYGAFAGTGFNLQLTNTYTAGFGYYNTSNGYSSFIAGVWNEETNSKGFNFTAGHSNHTDQIAGFSAGAALLKGAGVGCAVLGAANIDIASAQSGTDANAPMIIIGNGTHTTPEATAWAATVRSNLLVGYRNGEVVLPSTTIAIIDAELTGRQIPTKEWVTAQVGGVGSQSWQETVIVGNAITSVDTVGSFLEINRYANAIDIDLHDSDYTNNVYLYVGNSADGDSPGFSMDGDADDSNSWFTVDAGGIIDLKARSSSLLLFASQTYSAEAQKRYAGLTLDIDDMTLYSFNPNTNQGGTLTFNGTNERVHLIHKNGNAIENTLSIAKPTLGNSLTILPALNLPFGNNKYIPLFFTDGVTTVEASATGLVNISTITGGGAAVWGGITGTLSNQTDLALQQTAQDDAIALNTAKATFPEAPNDGTQYARKDLGWESVATGGDMLSATYDPIINANTAKVSNVDHPLVETAVPVGALFTDTIYDDTTIQAEVDLNTAKISYNDTDVLKDTDTLSIVTGINKLITQDDIGSLGGGDMLKSVYDTTDNGIVDNSELVNSLTVETAVPSGAVFTDTVYDDTTIQAEVTLNTAKVGVTPTQVSDILVNNAKVTNVAHPLVETAVPVGALFTDTVYDDTAIQAEVDLNTAKVGITAQQASDITANNAKISYTDASLVATHTTDISNINTAQGVQDSAIALNTAKVGVTNEEENTINSIVAGEPTGADVVLNVVSLTQAEYDAGTPIAGTQYNIIGALPGGSGEVNTINSVLTGEPAGSLVIPNIVKITQADYDAGTPVATTFYAII